VSQSKAVAIYEISPKVIDIQEGYNKNFHEIIGQNKLDSL
jgi:hypothetical protein